MTASSISWRKVLFITACAFGAAIAAYYGQPVVGGNVDIVLIIITVLTIFAGFLVAIMSVVGDPALLPSGSWRAAEIRRESVESELSRHAWLFFVYLIGIALLFVGALLHKAPDAPELAKLWIERLYLFFGVFGFLLSFGLPASILAVQMKRFDAEIEKRREEAGIGKQKVDSE